MKMLNRPTAVLVPLLLTSVAMGQMTTTGEELKNQLLDSLDDLETVATNGGLPEAILDAIESNRSAILQMPSSELENMPTELKEQIFEVEQTSTKLKRVFTAPIPAMLVRRSAGLPEAPYPNVEWNFAIEAISDVIDGTSENQTESDICAYPGYTPNTMFTTLNASIVAEATKDMAEQFCGQTVLGVNLSAVCVFTDILYFVAKGIHDNYDLCNDFITAAEVTGSYNRLGHIHGDLETANADILSAEASILAAIADHDLNISTQLSTHDADIKALLATLQAGVDENTGRLKAVQAVQKQIIRLLLTPEGRREVDPDVLTCIGDVCPEVLACPGGECEFPVR